MQNFIKKIAGFLFKSRFKKIFIFLFTLTFFSTFVFQVFAITLDGKEGTQSKKEELESEKTEEVKEEEKELEPGCYPADSCRGEKCKAGETCYIFTEDERKIRVNNGVSALICSDGSECGPPEKCKNDCSCKDGEFCTSNTSWQAVLNKILEISEEESDNQTLSVDSIFSFKEEDSLVASSSENKDFFVTSERLNSTALNNFLNSPSQNNKDQESRLYTDFFVNKLNTQLNQLTEVFATKELIPGERVPQNRSYIPKLNLSYLRGATFISGETGENPLFFKHGGLDFSWNSSNDKLTQKLSNNYFSFDFSGDGTEEIESQFVHSAHLDADGDFPPGSTAYEYKDPLDSKPDKLFSPRFRKIGGNVYLFGGYKDSSDSRIYSNKIWKFNEIANIETVAAGIPAQDNPHYEEKELKDLPGFDQDASSADGDLIDLLDLDRPLAVIKSGTDFSLIGKDLTSKDFFTDSENRYFFNSQVYCPKDSTPNYCLYSISGGSKNLDFENPDYYTGEDDFYSDFYLWKVSVNSLNEIEVKEILETTLPKTSPTTQNGKIAHQVYFDGDLQDGLEIYLYGGFYLDSEKNSASFELNDEDNPSFCTEKTGEDKTLPRSLAKAKCEFGLVENHNGIVKELNSGGQRDETDLDTSLLCSDQEVLFDPSSFLRQDVFGFYSAFLESDQTSNYKISDWKKQEIYTQAPEQKPLFSTGAIFTGYLVNQFREVSGDEARDFLVEDKKISLRADLDWSFEEQIVSFTPATDSDAPKLFKKGKWKRLIGSSDLPLGFYYGADRLDSDGEVQDLFSFDLNLSPIQSLSLDNKLLFSGSFDLTVDQLPKKFLGAAIKDVTDPKEKDRGIDKDFLSKIFEIKDERVELVQCSEATVLQNTNSCVEDLDTSGLNAEALGNLNSETCTPNLGKSKKSFRPDVTFSATPKIKLKESDPSIGYYKLDTSFASNEDGETLSLGNFFLEKKFSPGWHRVHLAVFTTGSDEDVDTYLKSMLLKGYNGIPLYSSFGILENEKIQSKQLGVAASQASSSNTEFLPENKLGPFSIYYKSFVYQFFVPEVSNYQTGAILSSKNPTFKIKNLAPSSQVFTYTSSGGEVSRLGDFSGNLPKITEEWSFIGDDFASSLVNDTSNKTRTPVLVVQNSPLHSKLRASHFSTGAVGTLDFLPSSSVGDTFSYFYVDDFGNQIGGPSLSFQIGADLIFDEFTTTTAGETLYETDSLRPFLHASFSPSSFLRLVFSGEDYFDEQVIFTGENGNFSFQSNFDFSPGVYKLYFYTPFSGELLKEVKILVSEKKKTPVFSSPLDGAVFSTLSPFVSGNAKPGEILTLRLYSEEQGSFDLECVPESEQNSSKLFSCNKLGKFGEAKFGTGSFVSYEIQANSSGNFFFKIPEISTGTLLDSDSKNNFFASISYTDSDLYDLASFRISLDSSYFDFKKENIFSGVLLTASGYDLLDEISFKENFFDCGEIKSYLESLPFDYEISDEDCKKISLQVLGDKSSLKIFSPQNGSLTSEKGKTFIFGQTFPNTKIKISSEEIQIGSTTSDEEGYFYSVLNLPESQLLQRKVKVHSPENPFVYRELLLNLSEKESVDRSLSFTGADALLGKRRFLKAFTGSTFFNKSNFTEKIPAPGLR